MSDPLQHHTTYSYDPSQPLQGFGGGVTTYTYDPNALADQLASHAATADGWGITTTTYSWGGPSGHDLPDDEPEPPAPDVVIDPEG